MSDRLRVRIEAGPRLPGIAPRIAVVLLGATAYLVAPPVPATIALGLTVAAAIAPGFPAAWGAILTLALALLRDTPAALGWRVGATLALVHLLHVVASLAAVVDRRGTLQAAVLIRPLRRWAIIQVPAQAVLALLLLGAGPLGGSAPILGPLLAAAGAAAAILITVLLARRR